MASTPMFSERSFEANGLSLNLAVGPASGPPLVLLHGVTRRWQDFLTLTPWLTPLWQVHALDFRGHGGSGRSPGKYRIADFAADAVALLKSQLKEPAILLGHSLGALVATAVAAELPHAVRAIVLEEPPGMNYLHELRGRPEYALFTAMRSLAGRDRVATDVIRTLSELRLPVNDQMVPLANFRDATWMRFTARCLRDLDPEVLQPLTEGGWPGDFDMVRALRGVRCPALLVCGSVATGGMLPAAEADGYAKLLADCTRADVPSAGHLIHYLEASTMARLVIPFLQSL
jgi:pimeloyl-ACP methyl ester carboxylesterase